MVHHHALRLAESLAAVIWPPSLRRLSGLTAGLSLITLAGPTAAAAAYPSVEQATFHQLLFANDDVAVLKNVFRIPSPPA